MSGGGGSGFCGTEERCDLQQALSIARGMVLCPPWMSFPGLSSHLPGWLYERGEVCTVWGGRDRCYPGGDGNACPRAGGEPATAGVLSYCPSPSTCSSLLLFCAASEMLILSCT